MTQLETPSQHSRQLSQLDEAERYRCFDDLQLTMPNVWESMRLDMEDESVVVVPSISIERATPGSGTVMQALEERALFLLLLLRQPRLRMIYVTSQPISESIIEYYLGLLPGVIPSHARERLTLFPIGDASGVPLSAKLLARPRILREIRSLIPNPDRSHLIPYNTTPLERDVALSLRIPMYGADPRLEDLGSKTGCRRMFEELGVRCPVGAEDLHTVDDIVAGVQSMRARRPSLSQAIVKLNEGVSGAGNAMVDLSGLPESGSPNEAAAIKDCLLRMQPESEKLTVDAYLAAFEKHGGIVEERITGEALTSPSVQMRALPDGTVELLSTHDQLLGGASGQKYLGCVFPANPDYAAAIAEPAMVIGRRLAELGALGRFAVDFVVVQDESGAWTPYAIELNLRKGGTTHPFLTLQFLTDGTYDGARGVFLTPSGSRKYLVATDHFEDDRLKALTVRELFDVVVRHGLHFDQARRTGVVFHMISCLTECGRVGLTAVGDTPEDAWQIYEKAQSEVLQEAEQALEEGSISRAERCSTVSLKPTDREGCGLVDHAVHAIKSVRDAGSSRRGAIADRVAVGAQVDGLAGIQRADDDRRRADVAHELIRWFAEQSDCGDVVGHLGWHRRGYERSRHSFRYDSRGDEPRYDGALRESAEHDPGVGAVRRRGLDVGRRVPDPLDHRSGELDPADPKSLLAG